MSTIEGSKNCLQLISSSFYSFFSLSFPPSSPPCLLKTQKIKACHACHASQAYLIPCTCCLLDIHTCDAELESSGAPDNLCPTVYCTKAVPACLSNYRQTFASFSLFPFFLFHFFFLCVSLPLVCFGPPRIITKLDRTGRQAGMHLFSPT